MGPLYSKKAIDKFLRFQTMAKRESKKTLLWSRTYETESNGYFVLPGVHMIDEFDPTSAYQSNVIMAPDLSSQRISLISHNDSPALVTEKDVP